MSSFAISNARDAKDLRFKVVFDRDITRTVRESFDALGAFVVFAGATNLAASSLHYREGTAAIQWDRTGTTTAVAGAFTTYATASDWSADTLRTFDWRATDTGGISAIALRLLAGTATGTNYAEWSWSAPFHRGWQVQTATAASPTATSGTFSATAVAGALVYLTMASTATQPTIQVDNLQGLVLGTALPTLTNGAFQNATSANQKRHIKRIGAMHGAVTPERAQAQVRSTVVDCVDRNGDISALVAGQEMRNRGAKVWVGYADVDEANFLQVFRGQVSSLSFQSGVWSFALADLRKSLKKDMFLAASTATPVNLTAWNPVDLLLYLWCNGDANSLGIDPGLVNWEQILGIRDTYLPTQTVTFKEEDVEEAKAWSEEQFCLPFGCYIISDGTGLLSLKHVHAPFYSEQNGTILDESVIKDVPTLQWGLADLVNEILWQTDYNVDTDTFGNEVLFLESNSLNQFDQSVRLDISSKGLALAGNQDFITTRNGRLFTRFAVPFPRYKVKTKLSCCTIAEGDIIQLKHNALPDTQSGLRGITNTHIVEVLSVNVDLENGFCEFELLDTPWSFKKTVVIAAAGLGDYDTWTDLQKRTYGCIGRAGTNTVGVALDPGYLIQEG